VDKPTGPPPITSVSAMLLLLVVLVAKQRYLVMFCSASCCLDVAVANDNDGDNRERCGATSLQDKSSLADDAILLLFMASNEMFAVD